MKIIVLAAGYATRMYPLTLNYPKALLPVEDKKVIDLVLKDVLYKEDITIVTNNRFNIYFQVWNTPFQCNLINDKSNTVNDARGVIKDLQLALENVNEDVLVLGADNVLDFNIYEFINFAKDLNYSSCMYYIEKDVYKLQKTGIACILNDTLIELQEKPRIPKTQFAVPPFYYFKEKDLDFIKNYNSEFNCFGNLLQALCQRTVVKCFKMPGKRIDYGTLEAFKDLDLDYIYMEQQIAL